MATLLEPACRWRTAQPTKATHSCSAYYQLQPAEYCWSLERRLLWRRLCPYCCRGRLILLIFWSTHGLLKMCRGMKHVILTIWTASFSMAVLQAAICWDYF